MPNVEEYERCDHVHPNGALLWCDECAAEAAGPIPLPRYVRGDQVRVEPGKRSIETDTLVDRFGVVSEVLITICGTHAKPERSTTDRPFWRETLGVRTLHSLQERPPRTIVFWCGLASDVAFYDPEAPEKDDPVNIADRLKVFRELILAAKPP